MYLKRELNIAQQLAIEAGQLALQMRATVSVTLKPLGQGPVTNADVAIERNIIEILRREFPEDRIIGEESFIDDGRPIGTGRTWFIDPIDGTSSYVAGNEDFVNMIGLAIDGIARLGVVYQPSRKILWRGIVAEDCLAEKIENENIIELVRPESLRKPAELELIASRTHWSLRQEALINKLKPKKVHYRSSVGLKAMLIVENYADLYVAWSKRIKMWDTCAPAAIIKASGSSIYFIDGQELSFSGAIDHGSPIMISGFSPDAELFSLLKEIGEQKFI